MQATKRTLKIEAEALSLSSLPNLLYKVLTELEAENLTGKATYEDGDSVNWTVTEKSIQF